MSRFRTAALAHFYRGDIVVLLHSAFSNGCAVPEWLIDQLARLRQPKVFFIDDGPGKPVGIQRFIGRRPIAAFGNSDGDLQMLQWTCSGSGARLCLYVHHTDGDREWAYDRASSIGKLDQGLDAARVKHWTVVDMKTDWARIFAFEPK